MEIIKHSFEIPDREIGKVSILNFPSFMSKLKIKKPQTFVLFRGRILWRDLICILLSATHEVRSKIQQSKSKIDILLQNTGKDFHICIQTSFSSIGREWTERRDYKRRTITSINVMQRLVQNAHKRSHFFISILVTFTHFK